MNFKRFFIISFLLILKFLSIKSQDRMILEAFKRFPDLKEQIRNLEDNYSSDLIREFFALTNTNNINFKLGIQTVTEFFLED